MTLWGEKKRNSALSNDSAKWTCLKLLIITGHEYFLKSFCWKLHCYCGHPKPRQTIIWDQLPSLKKSLEVTASSFHFSVRPLRPLSFLTGITSQHSSPLSCTCTFPPCVSGAVLQQNLYTLPAAYHTRSSLAVWEDSDQPCPSADTFYMPNWITNRIYSLSLYASKHLLMLILLPVMSSPPISACQNPPWLQLLGLSHQGPLLEQIPGPSLLPSLNLQGLGYTWSVAPTGLPEYCFVGIRDS